MVILVTNFRYKHDLQICWWDARKGGNPDGMIPMDQCHIDPVYKTIWLNAKQGTEFFTGSTDGMVNISLLSLFSSNKCLINNFLFILDPLGPLNLKVSQVDKGGGICNWAAA